MPGPLGPSVVSYGFHGRAGPGPGLGHPQTRVVPPHSSCSDGPADLMRFVTVSAADPVPGGPEPAGSRTRHPATKVAAGDLRPDEADALLYAHVGRPVQTPQGVGILQRVLGGRAVVEFPGLATMKRFRSDRIRPVGAPARE